MSEHTLVAVYDAAKHAEAAILDLKAGGVPASAISQHAANDAASGSASRQTTGPAHEQGFWSRLFGSEPDHRDKDVYDRSLRSGATVVTVRAPGENIDRISKILDQHNPIDLDQRAAQNGTDETVTTRSTTAPASGARAAELGTGGQRLELAEENLAVGKRAVDGGTTRVRRYVVEIPVEEQVSLHSEKVTLDRHPVADGRQMCDGNFSDKTIEMTQTSEEAVVSKTARVVEEVSLQKDVRDRTETVKDTLRHDEVEVEQVPGAPNKTARTAGAVPVMPAAPTQRGSRT